MYNKHVINVSASVKPTGVYPVFFAKFRTSETRVAKTEIIDNEVEMMTGLSERNFKTAKFRTSERVKRAKLGLRGKRALLSRKAQRRVRF